VIREPADPQTINNQEVKQMSNIAGKMVAGHNGNGYWTILANGEVLFSVVPEGFTGSLGAFANIRTFTRAEAEDLIHVMTTAVDGIKMGGWETADANHPSS
jgi:hypothetical protein